MFSRKDQVEFIKENRKKYKLNTFPILPREEQGTCMAEGLNCFMLPYCNGEGCVYKRVKNKYENISIDYCTYLKIGLMNLKLCIMKIELLMINSVLFLLLCSINSSAQQKVISNIEMKEDIEELFVKLNSIHVNLYDAFSEDSAILLKTNLINKLPSQLSQKEFTKKLIPLVARFNDGHTRIDIPKYEKAKQKELLPIKVHISEDNNIFVVGNYNLINDGDQIVEIDGISATHLVDTLKKYVSAEHEYFRLAKLSDRFSVYANYIFDINTKSVIRTKQGFNGILMNIKLNQIQNQTKIFDFQVYDTIAYLKLSIFMYPRQFFSIVDSSFEILKAKKIDKLIIDIRENSGGNTMLSSYLFNYLDLKTDNNKKAYSKTITKVSKYSKRFYWRYSLTRPYFLFILPFMKEQWRRNNTSISKQYDENKEINTSNPNEIFKGDVILLTSKQNYSAASDFVRSFKYFKAGIIVGEQTTQPVTSYGDIVYFKLKNSKIKVACSHRLYHSLDLGSEHKSGVKPDIYINWNKQCDHNINSLIQKIINETNKFENNIIKSKI